MKFAVDRIEGSFAILENIETGEKTPVDLLILPIVKEKDILVLEDNLYRKDDKEREERIKKIREKLDRLKRKN
ncbi:MAG: DUF3006 domain-containing protein [Bacilli bacterium]|nr:DUF3006 domain-containing protein [Bacilli bacterium]